ncbi:hypothetical protein PHLGIDRAFT_103486 [Phlebiopsis gigantea 11061_1 CR5-6]|uniref:Ketoreductase (KR) domain-containing protein n=1 Tax=Phlebiopsis gigantea (strain 11061_1 CR5-6) TaxID=745531 RepID=A0A0C3S1L1_PHLG1|nr:hypothetical protein PHLGIDRAFT_103486 [Phlebiopsis gigantea 11061_1 CR5-6]
MVLQAAYALASHVLPTRYYWQTAIGVGSLVVTYAFAQGRTTNRDRDLHARTIIVTGAFTPLGLTLISNLASRGAHVIAISPYSLEHPYATLLIPAMRTATKNENIYAEHADLTSLASVREFCTKFLTGEDQRIDGIVFAHEYAGIGSLFSSKAVHEERREAESVATFLMITLLLPALLVAPVERDIRIVNVVNPFYAAAIPSFTTDIISTMTSATPPSRSLFLSEGRRALRTIILTRHLQRILNALPNRAPTLDAQGPGEQPKTSKDDAANETSGKTPHNMPSNIAAVSVTPGMSRTETIRAALGADRELSPESFSLVRMLIYVVLFPVIWLLAKSSDMAMQSVLHSLFLPTPFKRTLAQLSAAAHGSAESKNAPAENESPAPLPTGSFIEVLKPGALYRECSVVMLPVLPLPPADPVDEKGKKVKEKEEGRTPSSQEDLLDIEDDGEYGGEGVGRLVWEWFENHLKMWEAREKERNPEREDTKTASS